MVIGGGERASIWAWELTAPDGPLVSLNNVNLIVGHSYEGFRELKQRCDVFGGKAYQGLGQFELSQKMSSSTCALITGGMIVYEALSMGVPTIVFPQVENLPPEAQWFESQGAIINLGFNGGMDMGMVKDELSKLINNHDLMQSLSKVSRKIIDGHGMARAVEAIRTLI
ncbi:MAG: hypothetical protein JKY27_14295 [Magnetovibrio sp.]|nr:hypothetical protein [Magnetovibrio sp.]